MNSSWLGRVKGAIRREIPIDASWFITCVECVVVCCRIGRSPAIESTDVHWGRRYWWQFWWLWRLGAIVVIMGIFGWHHSHCCQDVEWIGRQVQIVQIRWNERELPSKTIWDCRLIRVIVDGENIGLRGCNRRDWWHPHWVTLRSLCRIKYVRRVVSLRTGLIRYLFHIEHIRVSGINRDVWWHVEWRRKRKMIWIILSEQLIAINENW